MDQFFLILHNLCCCPKIESPKVIFLIEPSTFENIIKRAIKVIKSILKDEFITKQITNSPDIKSSNDFTNYKPIVDTT